MGYFAGVHCTSCGVDAEGNKMESVLATPFKGPSSEYFRPYGSGYLIFNTKLYLCGGRQP